MKTKIALFGACRFALLERALAGAMAALMAFAVTACGGGETTQAPVPTVDTRETAVAASRSVRWQGESIDGISLGGVTSASDGGLWVAGAEDGLFGRPFLRKLEGSSPNPCGAEGIRLLTEISGRFERRQGVMSMTTAKDGAFYLAFKGPAMAYVARFLEATCSIDPTFGDPGVAIFPIPGLSFPLSMAIQRDTSDGVLFAVDFAGVVHLKRATPQGTWDTNFGDQGLAVNPGSVSFWLGGLATAANGDILVSGSVSIPFAFQPALMKLDAGGHLIDSFGSAGMQRYPELSKGTGSAGAMVVESDRIVFGVNTAAGITLDDTASNDSVLAAVDLNTGRLLPSFGGGGFLRWDWGYNNSNMVMSWIPNGRGGYTGCGHTIRSFVLGQPAALVDITSAGQFDTSVPYQGRRLIAQTRVAQCAGMARLSDGRLAAALNENKEAVVMLFDR